MPCTNTDPCNNCNNCNNCDPNYSSLGCPSYPNTECVIYNGDDIPCLSIVKTENLNEVLQHIKDVVCALGPTAFEDFDYSCFSTVGIETQQQFVEFISSTLCEIIGSQDVGELTSLSDLYSLIQSLTTNLNLIKNQVLISCFQTLSGLESPQNISDLLTAIQTVLCDHEDRITALEGGSGGVNLTANDSTTIDFTTSGTANHTLTGSVILSPNANNSLTSAGNGLYVSSPVITPVDSQSVDLTVSGTLNHTLQADIIVSPSYGNILTIEFDGLLAKPLPIQPVDSTTIDFTFINDQSFTGSIIIDPNVNNILTATGAGLFVNGSSLVLSNNSVTNSILRDSSAYSVIGRTSGTVGDPADIVANADQILRRSGSGNLEFGTLVTNNIGTSQVTLSKIQNINSSTLLGRTSGGAGVIEQLTAGSHMNLTGGVLNTVGRTLIGITKFTTSGTWTKPSGCNAVVVEIQGAGGGGGSLLIDIGTAGASSGGAGGSYMKLFITSGLGATETVTVGSGGIGGNGASGYDGVTGDDSSFGAHGTAKGGQGGYTMTQGTTVLFSEGGMPVPSTIPGTAVEYCTGSQGSAGIRLSLTVLTYGLGGTSKMGNSSFAGSTLFGAGGCGNIGSDPLSDDSVYSGGDGGNGIVVVYEYT